jgi:ribosomal protein S12 methylthiotransferase accessory factor
MKFQSRIRFESGSTHRIMTPKETSQRVRPYMRRIGVTRIADTTGLDTIGMHVFSAIRPADADLDGISVYNGKGLTKADSLAGAMMEAIERYRAETWLGRIYRGTYSEIRDQHPEAHVMDPAAMRLQQRKPFSADLPLEWVDAWDLLNDSPAIVPTNVVLCPFRGPGRGIWYSSSHGLASGNCIEEAVCHALAELIERDAYTIAVVRSELVPRFDRLLEQAVTHQEQPTAEIDRTVFPSVDLTTLPAAVRKLVRLAERNNTEVWLRDVTSDIGIPTFVASLRSWDADGIEFPAMGLGCDPNSAIAAIRAITEAAQGRNVAIQGVREDARAVQALRPRAANERALSCCDGASTIPFHQISAYQNDDILDDLNLMIGRLKAVGVREAYAVDLTDPEIPASVARVIVPDMESWFLTDFKPESCALGWRATRYLGLSGENLNPAYAGQA